MRRSDSDSVEIRRESVGRLFDAWSDEGEPDPVVARGAEGFAGHARDARLVDESFDVRQRAGKVGESGHDVERAVGGGVVGTGGVECVGEGFDTRFEERPVFLVVLPCRLAERVEHGELCGTARRHVRQHVARFRHCHEFRREDGVADPEAGNRQRLRKRVRDDSVVRIERQRAGELAGEIEVVVHLVADEERVVLLGDVHEFAHRLLAVHRSSRVVRRVHDDCGGVLARRVPHVVRVERAVRLGGDEALFRAEHGRLTGVVRVHRVCEDELVTRFAFHRPRHRQIVGLAAAARHDDL